MYGALETSLNSLSLTTCMFIISHITSVHIKHPRLSNTWAIMNLCSILLVISPLFYSVSSRVYVTPDAAYLSSSLDITALQTGLNQVGTLIIGKLSFLPPSARYKLITIYQSSVMT